MLLDPYWRDRIGSAVERALTGDSLEGAARKKLEEVRYALEVCR
jgi:hypothetical protein